MKNESSELSLFGCAVKIDLSTLSDLALQDAFNNISRSAHGTSNMIVSFLIADNEDDLRPAGFDHLLMDIVEHIDCLRELNKEICRRWKGDKGSNEQEQAA